MTDAADTGPLPASANEHITENPTATPDEVLREAGLDESRREQVEHLCAVTRFTLYQCEDGVSDALDDLVAEGTVEWKEIERGDGEPDVYYRLAD
ncbi:hypothetical protein BRC90_04575 [Halobacteriales archaeon QS_4_69_34]|nr:MAG: hypothetical protein BRC90_04575 [Halobacteriales archaeon QS_4_69_34]